MTVAVIHRRWKCLITVIGKAAMFLFSIFVVVVWFSNCYVIPTPMLWAFIHNMCVCVSLELMTLKCWKYAMFAHTQWIIIMSYLKWSIVFKQACNTLVLSLAGTFIYLCPSWLCRAVNPPSACSNVLFILCSRQALWLHLLYEDSDEHLYLFMLRKNNIATTNQYIMFTQTETHEISSQPNIRNEEKIWAMDLSLNKTLPASASQDSCLSLSIQYTTHITSTWKKNLLKARPEWKELPGAVHDFVLRNLVWGGVQHYRGR